MTLKQLQIFMAVADEGSFSRAAEMVSLTQPTVSQHIMALEDELDVRLFDRTSAEVLMTAAGRLFYEHATAIIAGCEQAQNAIRQFQGLDQAKIKIGASTIPATCLIPDMLGKLYKLYPGICLELIQGDTQQVLQMLLDNRIELALVGAMPQFAGIKSRKIKVDRIILVAHPETEICRQMNICELYNCKLVMREQGSGTRQATENALRAAGVNLPELTVMAQLGSSEALRRAVLAGKNFCAFISALAVEPELQSGTLLEIKINGLDIHREMFLAWQQQKTLSPAASAFMELFPDIGQTV